MSTGESLVSCRPLKSRRASVEVIGPICQEVRGNVYSVSGSG
jgi:hypothetical protein